MSRGNSCKAYVGNLPPDVRTKDLEDVFYKFGKIAFIDLKNRNDHPYAFVEFEDPRDAEDAIASRDGYDLDGYRLRVEVTKGRGPYRGGFGGPPRGRGRGRSWGGRGPPGGRSNYRVLISGLPATGSWQDVKDHLREAGEICFADVYRDGTGVVEFLRHDDMKYAVRKLDDTKFESHKGETAYIRIKEDYESGRSRRRSRSRSYSPYGRRRSPSPVRRSSNSRSRSRSPY